MGEITWFVSFAPYEQPRYAVVVMVEMPAKQGSGGTTCAPIAKDIYTAIHATWRSRRRSLESLADQFN